MLPHQSTKCLFIKAMVSLSFTPLTIAFYSVYMQPQFQKIRTVENINRDVLLPSNLQ